MNPSFEELKKELNLRNVNLSYQRLKVLKYLTQNQCHPTVDQIFTDLHKDISTLLYSFKVSEVWTGTNEEPEDTLTL